MAVEGLKCLYCQAGHFPEKCDVVKNKETRRALSKSQGDVSTAPRKDAV